MYIIYNYPEIISPRIEILEGINFSTKILNEIKGKILSLISKGELKEENISKLSREYLNLIKDINQNSVIKNIFLKKNHDEQVELLNELLKELNDIKFSKKIDQQEDKLMREFDEKSLSDLIELKSQINKD